MSRRGNKNDNTLMWAIVLGVPAFLLMCHPLIFGLVFVPAVVFGIIKFVRWLKK